MSVLNGILLHRKHVLLFTVRFSSRKFKYKSLEINLFFVTGQLQQVTGTVVQDIQSTYMTYTHTYIHDMYR